MPLNRQISSLPFASIAAKSNKTLETQTSRLNLFARIQFHFFWVFWLFQEYDEKCCFTLNEFAFKVWIKTHQRIYMIGIQQAENFHICLFITFDHEINLHKNANWKVEFNDEKKFFFYWLSLECVAHKTSLASFAANLTTEVSFQLDSDKGNGDHYVQKHET